MPVFQRRSNDLEFSYHSDESNWCNSTRQDHSRSVKLNEIRLPITSNRPVPPAILSGTPALHVAPSKQVKSHVRSITESSLFGTTHIKAVRSSVWCMGVNGAAEPGRS